MTPRSLLFLALKNLLSRRFRVFLTIGGVTIGIASIVFLVSIGFGLEQLVTDQVANFRAFTSFEVSSANLQTLPITDETVSKISGLANVNQVERIVTLAGRARVGQAGSNAETVVYGANKAYLDLTDTVFAAGESLADDKGDLVVNRSLANLLGFENKTNEIIGQTIALDLVISQDLQSTANAGLRVAEGISGQVVGVTDDDSNPILYAPLGVVQRAGVERYTNLRVVTSGSEAVKTARQGVEALGLTTTYVGDTVEQINQVFGFFRVVLAGFGLIALVVAALGTFNVLTISLLERIREVGFLKALGFIKREIYLLFLIEAMVIGVLGGTIGIIAGGAGGWLLNQLLLGLANRANADPVTVFVLPTYFGVIIWIGSIVVGFLTGLYPARRAVKTSPLDALRYE